VSDDWRNEAACSGAPDPDLWFSVQPVRVAAAVAICDGCPVWEACLDPSFMLGNPEGIWGGYGAAGPGGPRARREGRRILALTGISGWSRRQPSECKIFGTSTASGCWGSSEDLGSAPDD
jgi:hypothetical protein